MNRREFFTAFVVPVIATGIISTGAPVFAAMAGASGTFEGRSNHVASGSVSIVEEGGKYFVEIGDDFSLDSGPDPRVALGKNGYDASTVMGELRSLAGAQRYEIPAGVDVSRYNEVWIWCELAAVPLGVASLN